MRAVIRRMAGLGILMVAAMGVSCGPPPPVLNGLFQYSWRCPPANDMMGTCQGSSELYDGPDNFGSPPLKVSCFIDSGSSPGTTRIEVSIGRTASGSLTSGRGMQLCGEITGNTVSGPTALSNSRVTMFFNGAIIRSAATPTCQVRVTGLTGSSVEGQLRCENAPDNNMPPARYTIEGQSGTPATMDPMWADFRFTTCATNRPVQACR